MHTLMCSDIIHMAICITVKLLLIWNVKLENHFDIESILNCLSKENSIFVISESDLVGKGSRLSWPTWTNHVKLFRIF